MQFAVPQYNSTNKSEFILNQFAVQETHVEMKNGHILDESQDHGLRPCDSTREEKICGTLARFDRTHGFNNVFAAGMVH